MMIHKCELPLIINLVLETLLANENTWILTSFKEFKIDKFSKWSPKQVSEKIIMYFLFQFHSKYASSLPEYCKAPITLSSNEQESEPAQMDPHTSNVVGTQ